MQQMIKIRKLLYVILFVTHCSNCKQTESIGGSIPSQMSEDERQQCKDYFRMTSGQFQRSEKKPVFEL